MSIIPNFIRDTGASLPTDLEISRPSTIPRLKIIGMMRAGAFVATVVAGTMFGMIGVLVAASLSLPAATAVAGAFLIFTGVQHMILAIATPQFLHVIVHAIVGIIHVIIGHGLMNYYSTFITTDWKGFLEPKAASFSHRERFK